MMVLFFNLLIAAVVTIAATGVIAFVLTNAILGWLQKGDASRW